MSTENEMNNEKINAVIGALESQRNRALSENANLMAELNMVKNMLSQLQKGYSELQKSYDELKSSVEVNDPGQVPEA